MDTSFSIKALAYNNLGLMAYVRGEDALAIEYYDKGIAEWNQKVTPANAPKDKNYKTALPEFYDCLWNKATCILRSVCSGDYEKWAEGWNLYENRFLKSSLVRVHPVFKSIADRVWLGQRDCRVVVAQEQGIGDNIMFARFIPQLEKQYNVKIDLQVDKSLGDLLNTNGISCPVEIDVRNYDYILPLGSVCRYVEYIDSAPYLDALPVEIPVLPKKLNIGLVWSGSSSHTNDRHRSCPVGYFKFLSQIGNVFSLNPAAKNIPAWVNKLDLSNSWINTAGILKSLDFVVTVDTSVAHLAGAMGIPTYVLQPRKETDFRWGLNNKENLWYSSVTVIQNPNDWEKCIENLKKEMYV